MRVINIVDSLEQVNYGIWNAALFTAPVLKRTYGLASELWAPRRETWNGSRYQLERVRMLDGTHRTEFERTISESLLDTRDTVIVTHGVWTFGSRWGSWLAELGFPWVLVPHGMLEPWPLKQKWFRKRIYRILAEDRYVRSASLVRAVSSRNWLICVVCFPGIQASN